MPVSSATCEVTRPIEAVTAFGHLGSLALAQTNLTTCKASIKSYLVSGAINSYGCATSFKFTMDMPTDNLACLGDPPDVLQFSGMNSLIATKPPYKSTISVEGYGVNVSTTGIPPANSLYSLGGLSIALPHATFTSKSFNNAVGTANATFNYTVEDTTALFSQT